MFNYPLALPTLDVLAGSLNPGDSGVALLHASEFNGAAGTYLSAYVPDFGNAFDFFRDSGLHLDLNGSGALEPDGSIGAPMDSVGSAGMGVADYMIEVEFDFTSPTSNNEAMVIFRVNKPEDRQYYCLYIQVAQNRLYLRRFLDGSFSVVEAIPGTGTFTISGRTVQITITVSGTSTSYTAENGTQSKDVGPFSVTSFAASTYAGLGLRNAGSRVNYFRVYPL